MPDIARGDDPPVRQRRRGNQDIFSADGLALFRELGADVASEHRLALAERQDLNPRRPRTQGEGRGFFAYMAEREGFEPPDPCESAVFKTAALNRSATSPRRRKDTCVIPSAARDPTPG